MNELKDIYGIELSDVEILISALKILMEESARVDNVLEMASYKPQRIEALRRKEAISFILKCIGGHK